MEHIQEKAERDLPRLRQFAGDLLNVAADLFGSPIGCSESDGLGFMALCFASRQAEYLKSVCMLVDAHQFSAALLVARCMLEGLGLLKRAAQDPQTLPRQWRTYAAIENLQRLTKFDANRHTIDPEKRAEIERQVQTYGPEFYTGDARDCVRKGKALPQNPYRPNWYGGETIRDVFDKVCGALLYEWVYWNGSRLMHWTVGSVAEGLSWPQRDTVVYRSDPPRSAATALATGFQALLETLALCDSHLSLGISARLREVEQAYLAKLQGAALRDRPLKVEVVGSNPQPTPVSPRRPRRTKGKTKRRKKKGKRADAR
jgi:hypothetical protein